MERPKKWIITLLVILVSVFPYTPKVEGEICNHIVAVINEEIVTQTELKRATESLQTEMAGSSAALTFDPNQLAKKVLQSLIDEKLQLQEAKKMGITVYPEEVDQSLQEIRIKNGLTSDWELEKALLSQNMTIEALRTKLGESILLLKFRDRAVRSKIHLTDAEISDYFEQHKKKGTKGIRLSHILFAFPEEADEGVVAQVYYKARQVWEELQRGKDFAEATREYSQDLETAQQGGDLGYLELEQICLPFKEEIAKLKIGQFSPPIRTSFGFHLIKVTDQKHPALVKNSAQWNEIKEILVSRKVEKYYRQCLQELKKRAYIEIRAADEGR